MADGDYLSIRKFADQLKTSEGTVRKAIKAKKITAASMDVTNPKRPKIHLEKGRAEWNKNFTPEKIQSQSLANSLAKPSIKDTDKEDPEGTTTEFDEDGEVIIPNSASYQDSLTYTQLYKAKTAQLEYNEKRGKLIAKDAVYKEYFAIAQAVRSAMQGIPDKIIDHIIAAGPDRTEAHKLLFNEITEALEGLSMKPQFK